MLWLRLPPCAHNAGKEANSGRARTVLLPIRARSAGARPSSPLVVLSPPRAMPSAVGALIVPRRSPPLGSRAATWPQRQDSAIPARRVVERQRRRWRWRQRSRPFWNVGCCRVPTRAPVVLVDGRAAGRQLDDARIGRRSPHGAPPAQGCLLQAIGRKARHP
jgi:hypothetical protein